MKVRIKKGVRPYGGRLMELDRVWKHPNGRETVTVVASTVTGDKLRGVGMDLREYNRSEVEPDPTLDQMFANLKIAEALQDLDLEDDA